MAKSARLKNMDTRTGGFQEHGWTRTGNGVTCVMAKSAKLKNTDGQVCIPVKQKKRQI